MGKGIATVSPHPRPLMIFLWYMLEYGKFSVLREITHGFFWHERKFKLFINRSDRLRFLHVRDFGPLVP